MFEQLVNLIKKPAIYEKGTAELWTDAHISKCMLKAHLNPTEDSATRKHSFVRKSVRWINSIAPVQQFSSLLDLGCGPGIYAEEFHHAGYKVTGVDFSERSVNYAKNSALEKGLPIAYYQRDYLTLDFIDEFGLVTIINFDFGVLSTDDRAKVLSKVYTALKPGGLFVFDVFTPNQYAGRKESTDWVFEKEGFFCAKPHICLNSFFMYEEYNTYCAQHIIITEQDVRSINIWEHTFTKDEIVTDLINAGFSINKIYGSIAGAEYCSNGTEMCIVAVKA
ncbi:MAG: class I SAM-dependent methyltransferase [Defluviitaleaceae bacterium]|nr:class I SAM-dependent methyltransferase [Defluviitaleaceae bacterium]